jgi:23S rRNA (guanosine2251-2'-O)-methyltransferase
MAAGSTKTEIISGVHPVEEALAAGETLQRIIIGKQRERDASVKTIIDAARRAGVPIAFEPEASFRRFSGTRHQHVVAFAAPFKYAAWRDVRAAVAADANALVVALDHVEDPHNLGAVMRNAEGAGALAVVIPDRRSAQVTSAVRRAAAGAASHLRVASVPNLVRALEDLKTDGCWVYGLATAAEALPYTELDFTGRCVIVVGSEGKGLSRLALERCDRLGRIPLAGKVASLNAASAAAVALFEAVRQRTQAEIVTRRNKPQTPVNP